jgi:hypothetical protein
METATNSTQVRTIALSSGVLTVLPNESPDDYVQLEQELTQQHDPASPAEVFHVHQMIHARWNLRRYRRLTAQAYANIVAGNPGDTDAQVIEALKKSSNVIEKLERLAAAAERAYSKAIRDLNQIRAAARKSEKQNEAKEAAWLNAEIEKVANDPAYTVPTFCDTPPKTGYPSLGQRYSGYPDIPLPLANPIDQPSHPLRL